MPLRGKNGEAVAWCAAVPFLRSSDLRPTGSARGRTDSVEGVRQVYEAVLSEGRTRCHPDQALIAMGHAYLASGQLSELSERRVLGGNQHALPAELFAAADYTALGHLHLAQSPAEGCTTVARRCRSPCLAEANYKPSGAGGDVRGGKLARLERSLVPRAVEMIRLPQSGLDEALKAIEALELPACPQQAQPFLEVRLLLLPQNPRPASASACWPPSATSRCAWPASRPAVIRLGPGLADGAGQRRLDEPPHRSVSPSAIGVSSRGESGGRVGGYRLKRSLEQVKERQYDNLDPIRCESGQSQAASEDRGTDEGVQRMKILSLSGRIWPA